MFPVPRAVKVASGSGWYHEAAIQDADQTRETLVWRDRSGGAAQPIEFETKKKGAPQGAPFELHRQVLVKLCAMFGRNAYAE